MDEEMRAHLARETEQNIARGMAPDQARCAARRAFGGLEQIKERERDARGLPWLEDSLRDLRHAARSLGRNPGFALAAVLTLTLGLTVNVTLFSFVSEVFLRPLPAPDPDRLVVLAQKVATVRPNLPLSSLTSKIFDYRSTKTRSTFPDSPKRLPTSWHTPRRRSISATRPLKPGVPGSI
jgi:hypothetical protein